MERDKGDRKKRINGRKKARQKGESMVYRGNKGDEQQRDSGRNEKVDEQIRGRPGKTFQLAYQNLSVQR